MTTDITKMTEQELRAYKVPTLRSIDELTDLITDLAARKHDYGTCVYAMSIAATAAFHYIGGTLGVTGFQASCADLDIVRRTRGYETGFRIVNYENLLYPQYEDEFVSSPAELLAEPDLRKTIRAAAAKLLKGRSDAHKDVRAHWKHLAELPVLDSEAQ